MSKCDGEPSGTGHLCVGRLAEHCGTTVSALRYYERIGLLFPGRSRGNRRRYRVDAVLRLTFIVSERTRGASIDEIRDVLETLPSARPPTVAETDLFLRRWRRVVETRLSTVDRCRGVVETGS